MFYICFLIFIITSCSKIKTAPDPAFIISDVYETQTIKPNIILILGDDIGYEIPSYTGGETYYTPLFDSLANAGVQFPNTYATPLCSPSRFELLSGLYNNYNYRDPANYDTNYITVAKLLRKYGYNTCVSGKWQLGGGDASIKAMGFNAYCVLNAFTNDSAESVRYINPLIYKNGKYIADSLTKGKYSEDIFLNYINQFTDTSTNPFFIYWAPLLVHPPFQPPPTHPDFATWGDGRQPLPGDTVYYPYMVSYLETLIQKLITNLQTKKLYRNTKIIFLGDNGTYEGITNKYRGMYVPGGKGKPTYFGMHVPCIVLNAGIGIDTSLVDLTDIFPQICKWANVPVPPGLCGTQMFQNSRWASYMYFRPSYPEETRFCICANTKQYIKYDSVIAYPPKYKAHMYNWYTNPFEDIFIRFSKKNPDEKALSDRLDSLIKNEYRP